VIFATKLLKTINYMKPNKYINIANLITLCRIFCLPFMVVIYEIPSVNIVTKSLVLSILFVVLAATDWLDGYIARRFNMQSAFGAFLDPVADKIMVIVCLLILLDIGLIHYWVALIIILRELIISALREWMAQIGSHTKVSVRYIGKLKTTAQMIAIPMLLFSPAVYHYLNIYHNTWSLIANASMYIAVVLTIWSMMVYLKDALKN
jgi:CDP-diacylglycerol--glycerol-3-phosphate 3-phosphatidyltransferase